jgi:hypothetical protein
MAVAAEGGGGVGVDVPVDEVLKDQFGITVVSCMVVVGLPVDLSEGFLEVLVPPDGLLDV